MLKPVIVQPFKRRTKGLRISGFGFWRKGKNKSDPPCTTTHSGTGQKMTHNILIYLTAVSTQLTFLNGRWTILHFVSYTFILFLFHMLWATHFNLIISQSHIHIEELSCDGETPLRQLYVCGRVHMVDAQEPTNWVKMCCPQHTTKHKISRILQSTQNALS